MTAASILPVILVLLLLWAAIGDLRTRIIPNRLNLAVAMLAPAYWLATGADGTAILLHLAIAVAALVVFGGCFAIGMMGGGDVKLIVALALWLPPSAMLAMLVWMALLGGVLTLAMLVLHRIAHRPDGPEVPYGVAIVAGTLLVMANGILTFSVA